jgi:hypothetical protein
MRRRASLVVITAIAAAFSLSTAEAGPSNAVKGAVAGGVGGAVVAGPVGALVGGVGGAVAGSHFDHGRKARRHHAHKKPH